MRKIWYRFGLAVLPFALLLAAGYLVHRTGPETLLDSLSPRTAGLVLLMVSVGMAVAFPILLRVRFHNLCRSDGISLDRYMSFQSGLMALVGTGGIAAGTAYLLVVPGLYLYGSVLAALYGVYSILPSRQKTTGELKAYGCSFAEESCE